MRGCAEEPACWTSLSWQAPSGWLSSWDMQVLQLSASYLPVKHAAAQALNVSGGDCRVGEL